MSKPRAIKVKTAHPVELGQRVWVTGTFVGLVIREGKAGDEVLVDLSGPFVAVPVRPLSLEPEPV